MGVLKCALSAGPEEAGGREAHHQPPAARERAGFSRAELLHDLPTEINIEPAFARFAAVQRQQKQARKTRAARRIQASYQLPNRERQVAIRTLAAKVRPLR